MDKEKIVEYFKGIKSEWGKITWPERKQVVGMTCVVLVIVICFTVYTYGIDILLRELFKLFKLTA